MKLGISFVCLEEEFNINDKMKNIQGCVEGKNESGKRKLSF